MSGDAYRDDLEALFARVTDRHARVLELESRFDLSALERIDEQEHARLARKARAALSLDFRPHGPAGPPSRAELELLEADLISYESDLEALAARAAELELLARKPSGAPQPPALRRPRRPRGSFHGAVLDEAFDFGESLRKTLGFVRDFESHWEVRPEPSVLPGRAVLRARFVDGETPVALAVEITPESILARYHMTLATTVARAMPTVLALPRTEILARALGFLRRKSHDLGPEVKTGDESFDATFAMRCRSPSFELGGIVRRAMLALARFDVPTLRVTSSEATLHYEYDPEPEPLRHALDVLSGLRSTEVGLAIVRR